MHAADVIHLPAVADMYRFRKPRDWERFEETAIIYDFLARHGLQRTRAAR